MDVIADPQATPLAMIIATAILCGVTGYMIGIFSSLGFLPIPFGPKPSSGPAKPVGRTANYDDEPESSEEEISEDEADHAPNWGVKEGEKVSGGRKGGNGADGAVDEKEDFSEECKLVLIVRTDLGMTKGKIAAQCSHATLACYKSHLRLTPVSTPSYRTSLLRRWELSGQAKIALQVKSEEELEMLQATAISLGLVAEVIQDAGRTQIAPGSHTVLGIGPGRKSLVDKVTGGLKLL